MKHELMSTLHLKVLIYLLLASAFYTFMYVATRLSIFSQTQGYRKLVLASSFLDIIFGKYATAEIQR